jgi:DNA-binding transcriptional ArsR family regulator
VIDSGEATRLQHERYLVAVNNPFRKKILEALRRGGLTAKELSTMTELNQEALGWHLNILTSALCIETEPCAGGVIYKLTHAGRVIDYLE